MNNKQVLVYGLLESTNDSKAILWDTSIVRNLWNFENFAWKLITVAWPGSGTRNKGSLNHIYW